MRVTAGKYKGRVLIDNKYQHIRPTADIVKQALFNKLAFDVIDARVLDLFSGSGALGIEAISRGAKEVIFVDSDMRSVEYTKANLKKLGALAKVLNLPFDKALNSLKGKQFDIILLDPPYKSELYLPALNIIFDLKLLSENGVIVCEHEKDYILPLGNFQLLDEKRYGIKKLSYLIY